jgi:hypothetical protein
LDRSCAASEVRLAAISAFCAASRLRRAASDVSCAARAASSAATAAIEATERALLRRNRLDTPAAIVLNNHIVP